jgi:hypothetical protein
MDSHLRSAAADVVTVHLLDSAQGHPVQTWRFADHRLVSIGRADDNDVVIADPHVSRSHVKLHRQDGEWTLVSTGRHGTFINDRIVAETQLGRQTIFRLGASGPTLRFERGIGVEKQPSETIDSIHPDLIAMLEIDEMRKQQEADEIAGKSLFRELQEQARRMKRDGGEETQS